MVETCGMYTTPSKVQVVSIQHCVSYLTLSSAQPPITPSLRAEHSKVNHWELSALVPHKYTYHKAVHQDGPQQTSPHSHQRLSAVSLTPSLKIIICQNGKLGIVFHSWMSWFSDYIHYVTWTVGVFCSRKGWWKGVFFGIISSQATEILKGQRF